MHELSLAERVLRIAEQAAQQAGAQRVTRVRLAVGALAHVAPDTLQFCCELAARGTPLEHTEFTVEQTPGAAWCEPCGQTVALQRVGQACPHCGGYALRITGGEDMQVLDIAVV
jgi:hydrogenase nickel incorporation protein HypA/HybF